MTTFKLFSAALILTAAVATPVAAQQVIQEPGNYAFYHPNGDVLNAGSTRSADALASQRSGGDFAGLHMAAKPHKTLAVRTSAKRY
jgi:hypothetical protein